jgi:hypothetical protein
MKPGRQLGVEPSLKYHPWDLWPLTALPEPGAGTLHGGEFDWGGRLPKSNGGARWLAQSGRKSLDECNGISQPDCETDKSSRDESRP